MIALVGHPFDRGRFIKRPSSIVHLVYRGRLSATTRVPAPDGVVEVASISVEQGSRHRIRRFGLMLGDLEINHGTDIDKFVVMVSGLVAG